MCVIGQTDRCERKGCEWKKSFNIYCWEKPPEIKVEVKPALKFVPAEDNKPFYTRRRKKGRVVKEEVKYTEVKQVTVTTQTVKKEKEIDFNKIATPIQDDWIKKIKTL